MADKKPSGKPSGPPPSGPLSSAFKDWLEFDWLLMKRAFFSFVKLALLGVIALAVASFVVRSQQQQSGSVSSPISPSRQSHSQPVQQGVYLEPNSEWTQIELSAKPTTVFLPAQPFHLDIRPGGDCQGWLDLGYERIPLSIGMPLLNRRIPVMVTVSGKGSVFFQAQPAN